MPYITKFDGRTDKTIRLGGDGNPSSIEGYFLGSKDTQSDYGPGKLHLFQTQEGVIGVWGKTRMNSLLTEDHRGQMVLVTFTGMIAPSKKGRRPSYGYSLKYDPQNTVDVSNIDLSAAPHEEDSTDDSDTHDNSSEDSSQQDVVEPPRPTAPRHAAVVNTNRQAEVQALLSKRR